ncbi:hypothetical protein C8R48DRAFT_39842 [Suillus tomentosus]|nr:hypothetical protein C8R48DRAFT_39842 [Suillus tomentosus]
MVYESFLMYRAPDLPQMYLLHLERCKKGSTLKVSEQPEERDVRKVILKLAVGLGWPAIFLLDMWSSVPLGSAIMMWKILDNRKIGWQNVCSAGRPQHNLGRLARRSLEIGRFRPDLPRSLPSSSVEGAGSRVAYQSMGDFIDRSYRDHDQGQCLCVLERQGMYLRTYMHALSDTYICPVKTTSSERLTGDLLSRHSTPQER